MVGMGGNAFELDGVTKTYGVWRALRRTKRTGVCDLSLAVPRGLIFGLLGLNGAGKTTAMKILVGLLRPERGRVRVLGGEAHDPLVRARIGYLPEFPYLPSSLAAGELLKCYGRMSGLGGRHLANRMAWVLEATGVGRFVKEPLRLFSKGMLQRVAMAQALLHGPEIVFADEPVSGLDPEGIREMREMLLGLKRQGVTVVLNSHQVTEVERICDRVGIMAAGRLVREGTVGELLSLARNRRYRITLLVRNRKDTDWEIRDIEVSEPAMAQVLARERRRGARVLQIFAQQGSLEEILLETVRNAG